MSVITWQRVESLFIAAGVMTLTIAGFGYAWWWPLALFLAFDLSALGYTLNTRVGALAYNAGHSYIAPVILAGVHAVTGADWVMILALSWAFHVAVDRAVGYGLKHPDHFQHTHLGWIGRRSDAPAS